MSREEHEDADPVQSAEQMALDPVVRRSLAVFLEHAGLANGAAIVERALEDDVAQAFDQGAMRVTFTIREGVMLPMARHPFLRDDGRGEPEPEPHGEGGEIMQPNAAMCLCAMQEQRNAHIREMTRDHDEQNRHPPSRCPYPKPWHCLLHLSEETCDREP